MTASGGGSYEGSITKPSNGKTYSGKRDAVGQLAQDEGLRVRRADLRKPDLVEIVGAVGSRQ